MSACLVLIISLLLVTGWWFLVFSWLALASLFPGKMVVSNLEMEESTMVMKVSKQVTLFWAITMAANVFYLTWVCPAYTLVLVWICPYHRSLSGGPWGIFKPDFCRTFVDTENCFGVGFPQLLKPKLKVRFLLFVVSGAADFGTMGTK